MSKWNLIRETELVEVYEKNNGDMFVSFNKKHGYSHFCYGFEERYQLGIEDLQWITAKAKQLLKGGCPTCQWCLVKKSQRVEEYTNHPLCDVFVTFDTKDRMVYFSNGVNHVLDIEDLDWITNKAKELFKER